MKLISGHGDGGCPVCEADILLVTEEGEAVGELEIDPEQKCPVNGCALEVDFISSGEYLIHKDTEYEE